RDTVEGNRTVRLQAEVAAVSIQYRVERVDAARRAAVAQRISAEQLQLPAFVVLTLTEVDVDAVGALGQLDLGQRTRIRRCPGLQRLEQIVAVFHAHGLRRTTGRQQHQYRDGTQQPHAHRRGSRRRRIAPCPKQRCCGVGPNKRTL